MCDTFTLQVGELRVFPRTFPRILPVVTPAPSQARILPIPVDGYRLAIQVQLRFRITQPT